LVVAVHAFRAARPFREIDAIDSYQRLDATPAMCGEGENHNGYKEHAACHLPLCVLRALCGSYFTNAVQASMESDLIDWLRDRVVADPRLRLGIGDDAAVFAVAAGRDCVLTVDLISDQVDFHLADVAARRVGRKALAVNLSDLAAMAARPLAAVIALSLPRQGGLTLAKELYEGMFPLAAAYDVAIAGGDTSSWDGPLVVSVTLVGAVTSHGVVRRDGGCVGDQLLVTGTLGGSILGKHFDFDPRVDEALWLNAHAELHAGMDISDGLAIDLSRLAAASHCGAVVDPASVPVSDAARQMAARSGGEKTPLDHALSDGEDFELLLAVPPAMAQSLLDTQPLDVRLTRIGELVAGKGLWQQTQSGRLPLAASGFEHRLTP